MMNKDNYAIIMAGGIGSRFWPWSTTEKPKQFLDIFGTGKTLLEQTFERLLPLCPAENILIVTNELYRKAIENLLPSLPPKNILCEPDRRNTAPCIAYGAFRIKKSNPNARILVAPSDHIILKEEKFLRTVEKGFEFAENNNSLLTLGIEPHKPETGYGYIQADKNSSIQKNDDYELMRVKKFAEKPNLEKAKEFLSSGDFYWNAGIFVWSLKSILKAFEQHLPKVYALFKGHEGDFDTEKEDETIKQIYSKSENISIDYGVMEKAKNVYVMATDIGWSDVGTWSALHELSEKDEQENVADTTKTIFNETGNCIIKLPKDKIAVIDGLEDYIIVDEEKALLVCRKSNEQKIRDFVNKVKESFGRDYI